MIHSQVSICSNPDNLVGMIIKAATYPWMQSFILTELGF